VRAANTGISAVIDPVGRIVNVLPLGAEGVLDARLPSALEPPINIAYGNYLLLLTLLVSLLMVGRRMVRS
jgi:Apolipoprotein N-acyltransferase